MPLNQNPREMLTGWMLHPAAANTLLLLLTACPTVSAWLPAEWHVARAIGQAIGGFALGMFVAGKGAFWQRAVAAGEMSVMPKGGERVTLTEWCYHPSTARVLLALIVVGSCVQTWMPKDSVALHAVALVIGTFAAGMLAARDAAIWQRIEPK